MRDSILEDLCEAFKKLLDQMLDLKFAEVRIFDQIAKSIESGVIRHQEPTPSRIDFKCFNDKQILVLNI